MCIVVSENNLKLNLNAKMQTIKDGIWGGQSRARGDAFHPGPPSGLTPATRFLIEVELDKK